MNPDLRLIDCHTHIGVDQLFYLRGYSPYGLDFRSLIEQSAKHGVERVLVFPCVSYFGWDGLELSPPTRGSDDFSVPYAFENRRMLEEIFDLNAEYANSAIPFAIIDPARKQKEQVINLQALRKRFPIRGLKIQPTVIEAPVRDLLDDGRCFLELAETWDIPLLIHSSIAADDRWSQASDILDIAEAWPTVRFCLAHSCRFDLPSLERLGRLPNAWFDCSAHCIHCDAATANLKVVAEPSRRLPANYSDPASAMKALYDLLPERMMWGSDAPFYSYAASHDGETLNLFSSYEREIDALKLLSGEEKVAIMRENIIRFLGSSNLGL